ncbi:beta-galactosidase [Butyrivibrio fibrisolvens]|uniref:beta-galactosidase n=1 Tax=Butyrivibrio fibrisolvens TaxID=831 RepID=UPI000413ACE2|nr:beta-galactosidase [Butyrivibrio fibrisolvens]
MIYKFKQSESKELVRDHLKMGGSNPDGEMISVTNKYFEKGGKPWIGIMGEYHFSRDSRDNWYDELCKMKAGGITIVATYLFWIYHEEIEGEFDFSGDLDIRKFVEDARRAGLYVILRIGPWAHGECRNGGFPDWLVQKDYKLRDNNEQYMAKARIWYEKIYEQVKGLFYKDGGNIIGIQFENELVDNAPHLLALKKLALEIGYEAPIYTVTGWNSIYGAEIPVEEVVPVFGAYVEAPWADSTDKLPLSPHYVFNTTRNDTAIGADLIKDSNESGWQLPYENYPYATCELGAGLHSTHHRRVVVSGMDAYALSLVKLGCGNNLIGYYMYHGGTNKIGKLSTFNESKASGYPNDYPILNYDFHTAMTSYGEVRDQYRLLNLIHLFVNDFGQILAPMDNVGSTKDVAADDLTSLRYAMRTDGRSGFVFINHYQRLASLSDVTDVVIDTGSVVFPSIDVKGDVSFILPFNLKTEAGVLTYATAQLLCKTDNAYFFVQIDGIDPEYKFEDGSVIRSNDFVKYGIHFVTLKLSDAIYARKLDGKLYVGDGADLYEEDGKIRQISEGSYEYHVWNGQGFEDIGVLDNGEHFIIEADADRYKLLQGAFKKPELLQEGIDEPFAPLYPDELNMGCKRQRFWRKLTVDKPEGFVNIRYEGDAAQIYADGKLVADEYYIGEKLRIPAKLIYGKESYLVYSELKDDCYREF